MTTFYAITVRTPKRFGGDYIVSASADISETTKAGFQAALEALTAKKFKATLTEYPLTQKLHLEVTGICSDKGVKFAQDMIERPAKAKGCVRPFSVDYL